MAQEYHERTKKMEQLHKKLQTGWGSDSSATKELESSRDTLTKMEGEERLLEEEVEDLRRRIAEEREGRIAKREGRVVEVMEVTETAVEGGVTNKKRVKSVGKGKALGSRFTGKTCLRKMAKTMSRSDMERIQRTKRWTHQLMKKEKEKTLNWMHKNLPTPRLILLRIRVGDFCSLGVGSFNIFTTSSPSLLRQQLSVAEARRCAENDSKGDKCSGSPSRGDPKRGQREGAQALLAPSAGASSGCENGGEKLESSRLVVDSRSEPRIAGAEADFDGSESESFVGVASWCCWSR